MACFPELDPNLVKPDPELAQQVPYDLAIYYLALPLAQENGSVSVAMAHPENTAAVAILQELLHSAIVPLRSRSETIRTAIQKLHGRNGVSASRILAWSATPEYENAVRRTAGVFAAVQGASISLLPTGQIDIDATLRAAQDSHATLTILSSPLGGPLTELISRCATPLVLVRGEFRPIERILVATRGFASDDQVLNWLAAFAEVQQAQVSLLPLVDSQVLELEDLLCIDGPAKRHMDHLLQRLIGENVPASLRIRPGDPIEQVVAELRQGSYDLLIIAAEAHGQFVARVLETLDAEAVHGDRPIFVLKPTDLPANPAGNHSQEWTAKVPSPSMHKPLRRRKEFQ